MFDSAEGGTLAVLIVLFVASQLAVAWTLRDRVPSELRWALFAIVLVAALIPSFPVALVVLWIALNTVTVIRTRLLS